MTTDLSIQIQSGGHAVTLARRNGNICAGNVVELDIDDCIALLNHLKDFIPKLAEKEKERIKNNREELTKRYDEVVREVEKLAKGV